MSNSEIKTFEDLWQKLMEFFDAILKFIKKAIGGGSIDVGATSDLEFGNITKNF